MEQPTRENDKSPDASRRASEGTGTRTSSDSGSDQHRNQTGGMPGGTMELARNLGEQAKSVAGSSVETAQDLARQAGEQARNLGEQAKSVASSSGEIAQDLARQAGEHASAATDVIYEQGARAGQYLTRNVNEYPLMSLMIAGAIGYGIAYLVHASGPRQSQGANRH